MRIGVSMRLLYIAVIAIALNIPVTLHSNMVTEAVEHIPSIFLKKSASHIEPVKSKALDILIQKYGKSATAKLSRIESHYGREGVELLARYGDEAVVSSKSAFSLVKKYGDRGYYLLKHYPSAVTHYTHFGDRYVEATAKFGAERITHWLDEAMKQNRGEVILKWLERFGKKGERFLERHWKKLLLTGFVALNSDSLIDASKTIAVEGIKEAGDTTLSAVDSILKSRLADYIGVGLLIWLGFVIFMRWRKESVKQTHFDNLKD